MYEFLVDEKKFETAFSMLLEIPFYDMNCQYPFIAPSIMQELKKAQKKAGFTEDQIFDMAKERYGRMLVENPTVPAIDVAGIVTSYIFGKDGLAQRVLKSYNIDCFLATIDCILHNSQLYFNGFTKVLICQVFIIRFFGLLRPCLGGTSKSGSFFMVCFPPCTVLQHSTVQGFNGCRIAGLVIL